MAGWVGELGVPIYREREVTGLLDHNGAVSVELRSLMQKSVFPLG